VRQAQGVMPLMPRQPIPHHLFVELQLAGEVFVHLLRRAANHHMEFQVGLRHLTELLTGLVEALNLHTEHVFQFISWPVHSAHRSRSGLRSMFASLNNTSILAPQYLQHAANLMSKGNVLPSVTRHNTAGMPAIPTSEVPEVKGVMTITLRRPP
jgi:hypothetical protein